MSPPVEAEAGPNCASWDSHELRDYHLDCLLTRIRSTPVTQKSHLSAQENR